MAERDSTDIWSQTRERLKRSVPANLLYLFDDMHAEMVGDQELLLLASDQKAYLGATGFYDKELRAAIRDVDPSLTYRVRYRDNGDQSTGRGLNISSQSTFSTFVKGECNLGALNATHNSIAPLQSGLTGAPLPNPLILYGLCGVGKTHLLHAIANQIHDWRPDARIACETVHSFFQAMRKAMSNQTVAEFRQRYLDLEVLLIDDFQFMTGKQRTQEEFGLIYNHLVESGNGLLVLTANQRIPDLDLDSRLGARLKMGLSVRIDLPDLKTRCAILRQKCDSMGLDLPEDCVDRIATQVKDARSLQGMLAQVRNRMQLTGARQATGQIVEDALNEQGAFSREPSAEKVLETVAAYYNVEVAAMISIGKARQIVRPRQIAMFLLREMTDKSYPEIGKLVGNRDHSTVMHAYRKISRDQNDNGALKADLQKLKETLSGA